MFTYFNAKNGVQLSRLASVRLDQFKIADNKATGVEGPGAQGGLIVGTWGLHNGITNSLFVGASGTDFNPGSGTLGLEAPAWHHLTVDNTTFANYNGATATGAVAKDGFSPLGGGWEVRFSNIKWHNADNRVGWKWKHESVFVDLDGTFSEAGTDASVVPYNNLLDAFPECYHHPKYGVSPQGYVCPSTTFRRMYINAGGTKPSSLRFKYLKVSYTAPGSGFVHADDSEFLRGKFRPDKGVADYLASLSFSNGSVSAYPMNDQFLRTSFWESGLGNGVANGVFNMTFIKNGEAMPRVGVASENHTHVVWSGCVESDECDPWINCTTLPLNCTVQKKSNFTDKVIYHMKRRTGTGGGGLSAGYEFNVPVNKGQVYDLEWDLVETDRVDVTDMQFDISDMQADDNVYFRLHYLTPIDHVDVYNTPFNKTNKMPAPNAVTSAYDPLRPAAASLFGSWMWDAQYKTVTMVMNRPSGALDAEALGGKYKIYRCPEEYVNGVYKVRCANQVVLGDPTDPNVPPEGDGTVYLWSNPETWDLAREFNTWTTALPTHDDTVIIPHGMLVRVDVSTPRLFHLEVSGVLDFKEDFETYPGTLSVEAVHILVRGRLTVNGTDGSPYTGNAEIVLHGDRQEPGFQLAGVDYGPKLLLILGELKLYGKQRGTSRWMRLREPANAGDYKITIANGAGWLRYGDSVVLAPTGYDAQECDELTVKSVLTKQCDQEVCDQEVTFNTALIYNHGFENMQGINLQGEVLLLSSNVVVRGGDHPRFHTLKEQEFGMHLIIPRHLDWDPVKKQVKESIGRTELSDIELRHGGQAALDNRYALRMENLGQSSSFIRRCAVHSSYHTAIGIHNTAGVFVNDSIVYHSLGTSYLMLDSSGNSMLRNLASRTFAEVTHNGADSR
jgi:hypothetical protein